jgi:hypothetical protein
VTPDIFEPVPNNPVSPGEGHDMEFLPLALQEMVPDLTKEKLELPNGSPMILILSRSAERTISVSKYSTTLPYLTTEGIAHVR